jgi:hypothetical protein
MGFFSPEVWYRKEVEFAHGTTWVLCDRCSEKSSQKTKEVCFENPTSPYASVAWAVFSCKPKDGLGEKHAIKIYMQYIVACPLVLIHRAC